MNTYVTFSKQKPKFKNVKGKYGFVIDKDDLLHSGVQEIDNVFYSLWIEDNEVFGLIGILSDEQSVCEWEKNILDQYQGGCTSLVVEYSDWWKFCPFCGRLIKVVDELKPLPLMGIEQELRGTTGKYWCEINIDDATVSSKSEKTKREAIESWNSLVGKLTGEK